jgi:non-specific serine/threonine protein kinase
MLETIRTFAAARLARAGDRAAARERHARHFAAIAAASEPGLIGPDAASWKKRLERIADDLHATLAWADEQGDVDLGLDVSASLWQWWLVTGRLAAGRSWLALFSGRAGARQDERVGRALCSAAVLAAENGDYAAAVEYAEQGMAIVGPLGLTERMALAATVLGSAQRYLGNRDAARRSFQTALDLRATLGDQRGVSVALNNMALIEVDDGNLRRAQELHEQALTIKRDLGEERSIGISLANLADVLIRTGKWDAADEVLTEAAAMAAGDPQLFGIVRCNQGIVAAHQQDFARAAEHFRAAIAAAQSGGYPHVVVDAMMGLGQASRQTGDTDEAVRQLRAAQALAAEIGSPQLLAAADAALRETGEPAGTVARTSAGLPLPDNLTSRQAEVLGLLAAGLTNKQIAATLFLSTATVERHLATIYRNLGLTGRVEAARYALANGLAGHAGPQSGHGGADLL